MSGSIPWQILESQYLSYGQECKEEFEKLIHSPEKSNDEEIIDAGRTFAKSFINFNNFFTDLNMTFSSYLEKIFTLNLTLRAINKQPTQATTTTITSSSSKPTADQSTAIKNGITKKRDTFNFMRGIMDECTHLANFTPPVDPELAIIINAKHDAYVPSHGVMPLTDIWQGSTVRYLNRGHVSAILLDNDVFRKAIADSLNLNALKYHGTSLYKGDKHDDDNNNSRQQPNQNKMARTN